MSNSLGGYASSTSIGANTRDYMAYWLHPSVLTLQPKQNFSHEMLEPLVNLDVGGINTMVFDGDAPHRLGICISQAWQAGEVIRAWTAASDCGKCLYWPIYIISPPEGNPMSSALSVSISPICALGSNPSSALSIKMPPVAKGSDPAGPKLPVLVVE